jgi:hypothetical protein
MVDAPKIETISFEEGFPPLTIPTIFCDGIANLAPSAQVMKFYLFRSDPEQTGKPRYKNQILGQVVMPISAFIVAAVFFEKSLKQIVEKGTISQDMVDKIKQIIQAEQKT